MNDFQRYLSAAIVLLGLMAAATIFFGCLVSAFSRRYRLFLRENILVPLGLWNVCTWVWISDYVFDSVYAKLHGGGMPGPLGGYGEVVEFMQVFVIWLIVGGPTTGLFFALILTRPNQD